MSDTTVIKEFLVKLGFQKDEASLKKFTDGVTGATKNVVKLVAAIQGAALTIGAGVAAFATNLERMYFAAIKTGASAKNLQAFGNAAANFGAQSEEALQSVQSLARFMRETPGSEGFLKALGVDTRDVNGKLRDTTDIMVDLGKAMQSKPYYMAKQYGDMFGISEDMLRAMLNGDFAREVEKQRALLKDSGFDKAAEASHKFMVGLRELQTQLMIFAVEVQKALLEKLGMSMEQVNTWVRENMPVIAKRVADVLVTVLNVAEMLAPAIKWVIDKFMALDKATDGWSTKLILLFGVFSMLGGPAVISGIWALASAFGALSAPILAIAAAGVVGWKIGEWINSKIRGNDPASGASGSFGGSQAQSGKIKKPGSALDPVNFFMGMGWTKEQAAGIVANLQHESSMNPSAVGDGGKAYGIAQWHPDRQANFKKWAGKDIRNSSMQEQLAFVNYELTQGAEQKAGNLLRASTNAQQAGSIVSRHYERPAQQEAEALKRANTAVQIAQTTNINVAGGDAMATGRAVAGEQERVNASLTRNLQVAYN
jgi:hypothetical protein